MRTHSWEQRKLGELATFDKGAGFSKDDFAEEGVQLFHYGRLYTDYECVVRSVDTYAAPQDNAVFSKGNEVVTPSSGETAEDIAIASAILSSGIMLGGGLNIIRPFSQLDPVFLALSISEGRQHYDLAKRAQGKSVVHLYNADLAESRISVSGNIVEQVKIGQFFEQFDALITLHQRKCDNAFQDGDRSADLLCCLQIVKNARRNRSKTYCFCCGNVRRNRRWCLFLCQRKPAFLLEGDAI